MNRLALLFVLLSGCECGWPDAPQPTTEPPPANCRVDPDRDDDGFAALECSGDDCDDLRQDVFPGADDTVGDGVDQSCDGTDGIDRDSDGDASIESGGGDCNDGDPFIHPGGQEKEDCVDENCDGLGSRDDDLDGDLSPSCGGSDCDDLDPSRRTGAPDPIGDGIDQSCDGVDGLDGDRDGHASRESGGDDCDDSDPFVYPGGPDGERVWRKILVERTTEPHAPALAIESTGVLHATWARGASGIVRHGRRAPDADWTHGTIDDVGDGDPDPALAIGPADDVQVAYRENEADELRWATNVSGAWEHESVDPSGTPGTDNAIAIGADGTVHIVYVDAWDRDALEHATRLGGGWTTQTVDADGAAGHDVTIVLDAAGAVHAAYAELGDEDLRHATNASGAWVVETIDAGPSRAHYVSMALAGDGALHVAYRAGNHGVDPAGELWHATNASGAWEPELVDDSEDAGRGTGIAFDRAGNVEIGYVSDGDLFVATNATGAWVSAPVATGAYDEAAFLLDAIGDGHLLSIDTRGGEVQEWTDDVVPDGIDQNCDGVDGVDADGDGHASIETGGDDCDDADAAVGGCG